MNAKTNAGTNIEARVRKSKSLFFLSIQMLNKLCFICNFVGDGRI